MRYLRFVLAVLIVGIPTLAAPIGGSPAGAEPFSYSSISVGKRNACAISHDGVLLCWGDNSGGWIFSQHRAGAVPTPTRIALPNNQKWKSVHVGNSETICGLSESQRAWCWGNHHLGSYFTTTSRTPVEVEFPAGVTLTDVQSGSSVGCATTSTQQLWCWGDAHYLGDGSTDPVRIPVHIPMPDNAPITTFDVGVLGVCAVTSAANMYCWGSNREGELGLGYAQQHPYSYSWTPVFITPPAGETWAKPAFGLERICAITTSGSGYCSGRNFEGSFGDGTTSNSHRFSKMQIPNDERITSIATGWYHTCVLTETDKMLCVGRGNFGELGTGTTLGGRTWRAPLVPNDVRFTSFAAGVAGTCALDSTGRVWCWGGLNWGSQGTGQVNATLFPETIAPVGSPSVISTHLSSIDSESTTINGSINPNGYLTSVEVELSSTFNFASSQRFPISISLPNNSYQDRNFSYSLTGLEPRTIYYTRIIAINVLGESLGTSSSFTTLGEEPSVSEITIDRVTGNEATASVALHPHRLSSSAYFEWSADPTFETLVSRENVDPFAGNTFVQRTVSITGLQPQTTYFVRAVASNRLGITTGPTTSMTTIGSLPESEITSYWASTTGIHATVNVDTGLLVGDIHLEISTSSTFDDVVRSPTSAFSSGGPHVHQFHIEDLTPMTNYWIRAVATNTLGSTITPAVLQRTLGGIPEIDIDSVHTDYESATIHFSLDTTGLRTFVTLQVSQSPDMTEVTEHYVPLPSSSGTVTASKEIAHLTPRTAYFFTITARNIAGVHISDVKTFTTLTPAGVLVNNGDSQTSSATVSLHITAPSEAVAYRVSNHSNFRNAKVFDVTTPITWELIASDDNEVTRSVFVQIYLANGQFEIYSSDIVLNTVIRGPDQLAPTIQSLRVIQSNTRAQATARKFSASQRFHISVSDRRSGVTRIEMKSGNRVRAKKITATRLGTFALRIPKGTKVLRVRVKDAAGNYSKWKTLRIR
jgi:alpha-tubulin suppressor-like RCC1 family protein/phosphodiesterase/alkaline phosphatase D-like protein